MLAKKSKKGKPFYGCEDYQNCNFMTWDLPISEKCPQCGATLFKKTGRQGKIYCAKEGCGYERPLDGADSMDKSNDSSGYRRGSRRVRSGGTARRARV